MPLSSCLVLHQASKHSRNLTKLLRSSFITTKSDGSTHRGKQKHLDKIYFFLYSGITAMSWNRHSLPESSLSYTSLKSISSTAVSFNSVQELPRQCQRSYFRCSFGWTHEKTCWPRDYALLQDKTFEFRRLSVAKSIFPIIRSAVKKNSRSTTTTSN